MEYHNVCVSEINLTNTEVERQIFHFIIITILIYLNRYTFVHINTVKDVALIIHRWVFLVWFFFFFSSSFVSCLFF